MIEARAFTGLYDEYVGVQLPGVEYAPDLSRLAGPDLSEVLSTRVWIQQDLVAGGAALREEAVLILRLIAESRAGRQRS